MTTLDEVYRKFGEVYEAVQLLEPDLGNVLITHRCIDAGLLENPDAEKATSIYRQINHKTLGRLAESFLSTTDYDANLEQLLNEATLSRNRLTHSFYLQHNFRRNSEEGRALMWDDLEDIHETILAAIKAISRLSGIDLDKLTEETENFALPTEHLPIPYELRNNKS